jgi:hypothetical protein
MCVSNAGHNGQLPQLVFKMLLLFLLLLKREFAARANHNGMQFLPPPCLLGNNSLMACFAALASETRTLIHSAFLVNFSVAFLTATSWQGS